MKKSKLQDDELRPNYERSDFAKIERGKFLEEVRQGAGVAILEPEIAAAFPTSQAVNEALAGLLALSEKTVGFRGRTKGRKARAA